MFNSLSEEQIGNTASELLSLAEKNKSQIEIFFHHTTTEKMKGEGRTRISGELLEDAGFSIRLLKRGRIGAAAASFPVHQESIRSVFNEALGNIGVRRAKKFELEQFTSYGVSRNEFDDLLFNKSIIKMTAEDLIDLTVQLASVPYMVPEGQSITTEVSKTVEYIHVMNSNDCDKSYLIGWLEGRIVLSVERQKVPAIGFTEKCSRDKLNVKQIGVESLRSAEMHLQKHQLSTRNLDVRTGKGNLSVIWSPKALADILAYSLVPAIRSRKLLRVDHPFLAVQDQRVAPEFVSIYDDPLKRYGLGSVPFDDAGNSLERWNLVKSGIQEHFISDLGRRSLFRKSFFERRIRSYQYPLSIFPTNLTVKLDEKNIVDNIIESCSRGLFVKTVTGSHGANASTGDFSVGLVEAYLIKDGILEGPVIGEVSGNSFELLKSICLGSKQLHEIKPINAPYAIVIPEIMTTCSTKELRIHLS
ncbi:MAG: metallopeptidase TldD-related protein [Candidatus Hodarchaeales archaeon]|jgi:PmbA protein